MSGKVNPVIPEMVNQVCFDIIGGDVTVTMAAEAGQLQLNMFEPIIAFRLLSGMNDLVCKRGLMTRDQLDRLLNPEAMTAPRATPATDH